jgi:hypothetical protein
LKQIVHYGQIAELDGFQQYDYGSDKANIAKYGTKDAPRIPIENLTEVPVAMFAG